MRREERERTRVLEERNARIVAQLLREREERERRAELQRRREAAEFEEDNRLVNWKRVRSIRVCATEDGPTLLVEAASFRAASVYDDAIAALDDIDARSGPTLDWVDVHAARVFELCCFARREDFVAAARARGIQGGDSLRRAGRLDKELWRRLVESDRRDDQMISSNPSLLERIRYMGEVPKTRVKGRIQARRLAQMARRYFERVDVALVRRLLETHVGFAPGARVPRRAITYEMKEARRKASERFNKEHGINDDFLVRNRYIDRQK